MARFFSGRTRNPPPISAHRDGGLRSPRH